MGVPLIKRGERGGEEEMMLPYIPVSGHKTEQEDVKKGKGAKLMKAMGYCFFFSFLSLLSFHSLSLVSFL